MATQDLVWAYMVAGDRTTRGNIQVYIYWVTDEYNNGGYIIISDAFLPQLSMQYDTFEYIDTVYAKTKVELL